MELYLRHGGGLRRQKLLTAEVAETSRRERKDDPFCFCLRFLRLFSANFAAKGFGPQRVRTGRPVRCGMRFGAASGPRICAWNFRWEGLAVGPDGAVFEVLLLPDGHGALEGVDEPSTGLKRGRSMRRSNRDQHAGLANFKTPQPVDDRNVANLELLQSLSGQ